MNKIAAIFGVLRHGESVLDPKLWKDRSAAVVTITALIYAILYAARAYGYELPITPEQVDLIALGVVTVVSLYFTYATSDKVGVLPAKRGPDAGVQGGGVDAEEGQRDLPSGP